jgi:hypothetical protein
LHTGRLILILVAALCAAGPARAQQAPWVGYVYPPGGRAGGTVEVHLGGYDWTPDLQYFVHNPRVKLEIAGSLTPIFITPPPYWSGPKTYANALPIPRELPARLTLPSDLPPGPVRWQVANANGGSSAGVFWVGSGPEVLEEPHRREPQALPALPLTVNGRISRISEVDRYRFSVPKSGPVTCELFARRLGADFNGVLEVRDARGRLVADMADTEGRDGSLTFAARAGEEYVIGVHDVDFNGDRAFVYRLELTPGPRVLAAYPAAGRRGETTTVEFVGIGVATGTAKLESVTRQVTFPGGPGQPATPNLQPATPTGRMACNAQVSYRLETQHGTAPPFALLVSDRPEAVEGPEKRLPLPGAVTGALEKAGEVDRYSLELKKGERVSLGLQARRIGSPLDVTLAVLGPDGKEAARSDDAPDTTDAALELVAPADGTYTLVVSEIGGRSGSRAAAYRLAAERAAPGFRLEVAQRVNVLLGGKAELLVKAHRTGGFDGPIALRFSGLPEGVSAPADAAIPEGKSEVKVPLAAAADAPAVAALATVTGTATIDGRSVTETAACPAGGDLAPRGPEENALPVLLVSTIMKARWKVTPVDREGGRTVHRGTTYPAEVIIERTDGWEGPLELQMAAQQARHRMGIRGPDLPVAAGVTRTHYPCFMPEWLSTFRTSRMILIAVGKLADPRGNVRYLVAPGDGRITMSIEGALLKVTHDAPEMTVRPGEAFEVPVTVARSATLPEAVRLELRLPEGLEGTFSAEPVLLPPDRDQARVRIVARKDARLRGTIPITIRATAMQHGNLPVISETTIDIHF